MAARTLTEALRALPRDELVALLRLRPDLAYPLPTGLADLAARATTSTSVARAVDGLNAWQRLVCEGLAASPDPVTIEAVAALLGSDPDPVRTTVAELSARALCWGGPEIHVVRAVRDVWGPYPGGLAPPSARPTEASTEALSAEETAVLERLLWGPPTGAVRNADRAVNLASATSPVERLLARGLLRPLDADTVILPREVALALREPSGLVRHPTAPHPPAVTGPTRDARLVTRAGVGAAYALLHDADSVAAALAADPPRLLRAGGVGARDVAALARDLGQGSEHAGFLLELLAGAGLIGPGDRNELLPTAGYDRWAAGAAAERWQSLLDVWAGLDRWPGLAAEGGHPLGPEPVAARAAETRRLVLRVLADVPAGTTPDLGEVGAAVRWYRPTIDRGGPPLAAALRWTWREAEWLGLVALRALTDLVAAVEAPLSPELAASFPDAVEHLVIQSDLTAVAPGPLTSAVLADLRTLADQESRGGGGVFRFSAASVRRAYDAGWSAEQIHAWLTAHASTAIPQPLTYLVDDVARRHGSVRVGSAVSYVRCEDPAQTASLLAHPEAARLGLRLLAPGVLVGEADPDEVVAFLQGIGLAPAAEDAGGALLTAPARRRGKPVGSGSPAPRIDPAEVADAVLAADVRRPQRDPDAPDGLRTALSSLEDAARREAAVRVSYLNGDGREAEVEVRPLQLADGLVRAVDRSSQRELTIPLSRISSVRPGRSGR